MTDKKKKIFLVSIIITFLLIVATFIVKVHYPNEFYPHFYDPIGDITEDTILTENITSKMDVLDRISVIYANFDSEFKKAKMNVKIYNPDDELIYYNEYLLSDIDDNQTLYFDFDLQRNVKNKIFKLVLDIKDLDEGTKLTFYSTYSHDTYNYPDSISPGGYIGVIQHGQTKGYYYSVILGFILLIQLTIFMYKKYSNDDNIEIKNKKLNNVFVLIASAIMAVTAFDCRTDMSINYQLSFISFFSFLLTSVFLIRNIIISLKQKDYADIFLALAIPLGSLFWVSLVPGVIPDEAYHYNIVNQVSRGNFLLQKFKVYMLTPELNGYEIAKKAIFDSNAILFEWNGGYRVGGYPVFLYLPSALGMFLGHIFNFTELSSMYIGSYFNFLVFLILGYYVIKYLPFGKLIGIIYLLNPMNLHQCTSLSCDMLINMTCLLFIAYILHIKYEKEELTLKDSMILSVLTFYVIISKYAYFPLIGLLWFIKDKFKDNHTKKIIKKAIIPIIITLVLCLSYYILNKYISSTATFEKTITSSILGPQHSYSKIEYFLLNPFNSIYMIVRTISNGLDFYIISFAGGKLGWLEIFMPQYIIAAYLFLMLTSVFINDEKYEFSKTERKIALTIVAFNIIVIFGGLYFGWGDSRNIVVEGVQGRYFIPILLLPLLAFKNKKSLINRKNYTLVAVITISLVNIIVVSHIMTWFLYR